MYGDELPLTGISSFMFVLYSIESNILTVLLITTLLIVLFRFIRLLIKENIK